MNRMQLAIEDPLNRARILAIVQIQMSLSDKEKKIMETATEAEMQELSESMPQALRYSGNDKRSAMIQAMKTIHLASGRDPLPSEKDIEIDLHNLGLL